MAFWDLGMLQVKLFPSFVLFSKEDQILNTEIGILLVKQACS